MSDPTQPNPETLASEANPQEAKNLSTPPVLGKHLEASTTTETSKEPETEEQDFSSPDEGSESAGLEEEEWVEEEVVESAEGSAIATEGTAKRVIRVKKRRRLVNRDAAELRLRGRLSNHGFTSL